MPPEIWIVALWLVFGATHTVPSSARLRPLLVAKIGAGPFLGLYSLLSLGLIAPLVTVWLLNLHGGEVLWSLRGVPGLRLVALWISGIAFAFSIASLFQPSPASLGRPADASRGLTRITRQPLFLPFAFLAAMHLLVNGFATDIAFFGGLLVYTLAGCAHQDRRKRATEPGLARFFEETSFWPFLAIVSGRNRLVLAELPWHGLLIGGAAAYGFYYFHPLMFD